MRIRAAVGDDAPALGRVMVMSWLAAHHGQIPDAAWEKREAEWTSEVSARGWSWVLAEHAGGSADREVLLVAEDDAQLLRALAYAVPAEGDPDGSTAVLSALYVSPDHRGQGIGAALLKAVARELAARGFTLLRVDVLTANRPARRFYEVMGAHENGQGTFDEEGHLLGVTVYEWAELGVLVG